MVKMGAREFVYPNFGYRSRWLRNRDPVYCCIALPRKRDVTRPRAVGRKQLNCTAHADVEQSDGGTLSATRQ